MVCIIFMTVSGLLPSLSPCRTWKNRPTGSTLAAAANFLPILVEPRFSDLFAFNHPKFWVTCPFEFLKIERGINLGESLGWLGRSKPGIAHVLIHGSVHPGFPNILRPNDQLGMWTPTRLYGKNPVHRLYWIRPDKNHRKPVFGRFVICFASLFGVSNIAY